MKICLVNADFTPLRGSGQTVYAEKIATGLAKEHQVMVVTSSVQGYPVREQMDGIDIQRIETPPYDPSRWIAFGYKAAQFLRSLNKKERFDIVHFLDAHVAYASQEPYVVSLLQSFHQRLTSDQGRPYASSFSNFIKRYPYYLIARILEKHAVKKASSCIAISQATREEFVTHYQLPVSNIRVVLNGINTDFFKPTDATHLKKRWGLKDESVLLYVGFTTPRKGLETLFQAMERIRTKPVKLILVGKWEKGYKEAFDRKFSSMKQNIIETGYVKDEDLPAYYSLADIFVLPSLLEGFGFPLAEALSCGTPVISTSAGSIPEVVGPCGILVPPRDATRLAEAIDRLLTDTSLYLSLKSLARPHALDRFSNERMIQDTIEFYKKSMKSGGR